MIFWSCASNCKASDGKPDAGGPFASSLTRTLDGMDRTISQLYDQLRSEVSSYSRNSSRNMCRQRVTLTADDCNLGRSGLFSPSFRGTQLEKEEKRMVDFLIHNGTITQRAVVPSDLCMDNRPSPWLDVYKFCNHLQEKLGNVKGLCRSFLGLVQCPENVEEVARRVLMHIKGDIERNEEWRQFVEYDLQPLHEDIIEALCDLEGALDKENGKPFAMFREKLINYVDGMALVIQRWSNNDLSPIHAEEAYPNIDSIEEWTVQVASWALRKNSANIVVQTCGSECDTTSGRTNPSSEPSLCSSFISR